MKNALRMLACAFMLNGVATLPALAEAPQIRPGLWQHSVEMSSKSGRIEQAMEQQKKMMASMPPEQRKMMKAMMAQQGVSVQLGSSTVQTCLTQEQIDSLNISKVEEGCQQTTKQVAKNRYSVTLSCPEDGVKGKGEYLIQNDKAFTGNMVMDVNMQGQADTITSKVKGKWIGADCGNLTH